LRDGDVTVGEAEKDFRLRVWVQRAPERRTLDELLAWEPFLRDDFPLEGSFEEVDAADNRGEILNVTYWRLWRAYIESQGMRVS